MAILLFAQYQANQDCWLNVVFAFNDNAALGLL